MILLHGFGSFWWSWRHQLRGLTGARVVAVDLRGYGGSDKPPRGYDGWTLAGDTAGLVRALGHKSATLVGHADGGLVCWATSVLHPRMVRAIARGQLTASGRAARLGADPARPGPRAAAVDAALPGADVAGAVADPQRRRRSSSGWCAAAPVRKWLASEDFSETIRHMRRAIQIPSAAHSALEYQRWAVRSQLRGEGRRFMRSMKRPLAVPVLHMRGDADPYVLADPVYRTQHYAPHGRYVSIAGAGHFGHEEAPERGQRAADAVPRRRCTAPAQADAGAGGHRAAVLPIFASWRATSLAVSTKPVSASSTAAPNTTPSTLPVRSIIGPPELPCRTVPLIVYTSRVTVVGAVDVGAVELDGLAHARRGGDEVAAAGVAQHDGVGAGRRGPSANASGGDGRFGTSRIEMSASGS